MNEINRQTWRAYLSVRPATKLLVTASRTVMGFCSVFFLFIFLAAAAQAQGMSGQLDRGIGIVEKAGESGVVGFLSLALVVAISSHALVLLAFFRYMESQQKRPLMSDKAAEHQARELAGAVYKVLERDRERRT